MSKKNESKNPKNKKSIKKKDGKSIEPFDEKELKIQLKSEDDFAESAKSELKESEKKLQLIIDAMPAVISYVNTEYKFQFANKFFKLF